MTFIAVIRNFNGRLYKTSRSATMLATPVITTARNLGTYMKPWPQHQARYIAFGTSNPAAGLKVSTQFVTMANLRSASTRAVPAAVDSQDTTAPYGTMVQTLLLNMPKDPQTRRKKVTLTQLQKKYQKGEKLTMITAYDASASSLADQCGFDMILVGDSVGFVESLS